jgi:hypothetical protein
MRDDLCLMTFLTIKINIKNFSLLSEPQGGK